VDRAGSLGGEHLDKSAVGRLVRALPDILGVLLRRVVVAEGGLDPALGLGGVARLERALGHQRGPCGGPLCRESGGEPGGAAADDEHVE
jgi:hypothetical protein